MEPSHTPAPQAAPFNQKCATIPPAAAAPQNSAGQPPPPTPDAHPSARRRLLTLPARLLRPLSREGRRSAPLWYLAVRPTLLNKAPTGAPWTERMARHCESAATALFWPIGRALTVWLLWLDPPCPCSVRGWWAANKAARHNHTAPWESMMCGDGCLRRAAGRPASIPQSHGGPVPYRAQQPSAGPHGQGQSIVHPD